MNCPGSVKLSEQYPQTTTRYADEGSLAHAAAEYMINGKKVPEKLIKRIRDFYEDNKDLNGSPESMLKILKPYVDYIEESMNEALAEDKLSQLLTEQKVDLSPWIDGGFGTTDVAIIREGFLHIVDLKYGKGVPVSAEDNPQLKLYALGTLDALDMAYSVERVRMTIYQPRLDNVSTAEISAKALYEWGEKIVKPAAWLAMTKDAPHNAGSWCKFCPAKADCRERAAANLELEEYKKKTTLSLEEIGEILGRVDELVKWAEDLKEKALENALEGEEIPGWKIVEGRANRKYCKSDDEIVKALTAAGYPEAMLFEKKLLTITKMEDYLGKKAFGELLKDYVDKPQGKPALAPVSDKRPAMTIGSTADDFADLADTETSGTSEPATTKKGGKKK
jgi:hypothetical protein